MNPLAVANKILDAVQEQGLTATHMQLQKLLYFANGWHLETTGGHALVNGNFEAWQFGPVMPAVYHAFKYYGASDVTGRAENPFSKQPYSDEFSAAQSKLISEVVTIYGPLSGAQMSDLTHKEGTPWHKVREGGEQRSHISSALIHAEFCQLREKANARQAENV